MGMRWDRRFFSVGNVPMEEMNGELGRARDESCGRYLKKGLNN